MLKSKRKCNFQNVYSAKDVILLFLFETYAIYIYTILPFHNDLVHKRNKWAMQSFVIKVHNLS